MRGVRKAFGPTVAIDAVDFDVRGGEVHALVGENGAGKSTLMKVLSGATRPDAGSMWLDGARYQPRTPATGRRAGVAMIYQELSLAPHLTVTENICLGAEPGVWPLMNWGKARETAGRVMAQVGRPDVPMDVPVAQLPPAIQQLVEVARHLAGGCRVMVFDEPTSSLAQADAQRLFGLIGALRGEGLAIVYISHFLEEVQQISDRFTVLRDGRVAGSGVTSQTPVDAIVRMMVGREVSELFPRSARQPGEVVLEIDGFGGGKLPVDASLSLRRGEVVGIAGLIGAGRTELLRTIFGLDRVRRGRVRVLRAVGPRSPYHRWRHGAGMLSEDRKGEGLARGLSIAHNVTLANMRPLGPPGIALPGRERRTAAPWLERLDARYRSTSQSVASLSGGNQQKVAVARLLHADCDVLLLDEPTRGIDVGSKALIYELIDELATGDATSGRRPRAVLMVSSYLPELLGVCDRIAVMRRGRLGPARSVAELDEHQIMLEATGVAGDEETVLTAQERWH